jgi:ABC-2 type transport system permease protein
MATWQKFLAFLRRDLRTARTYRFSFVVQLFGIASGLWMYFFLGRMVGDRLTPALAAYGSSFFSFVLVGVAFWGLLAKAMLGTLNAIQSEQRSGTMEALLVTPTRPWLLILGGLALPLILGAVELLLYLAGGALFFHVDLTQANWPAVLLLLTLTVAHGAALGLFIASFIIVVKRGDSIALLPVSVLGLLIGIFYPVEVLPAPLQLLSNLIPLTYALRGMRQALFRSASLGSLWIEISVMALSTAVLAALAAWVLNRALGYARIEGSLARF